jgi:hypothetical protein
LQSVCRDMINVLPEERPRAKDLLKNEWF